MTVTHEPEPSLEPQPIPLEIIYEDEELAVINKPKGLVVHPGAGNVSETLVHALLYHFDDLAEGGGPERPGLVHRLDKDTSGLLVVAKTNSCPRLSEPPAQDAVDGEALPGFGPWRVREDEGLMTSPLGAIRRTARKWRWWKGAPGPDRCLQSWSGLVNTLC